MYITNLTVISKDFFDHNQWSKITSHEINFYYFFLSNLILCSFTCQHNPAPKGFDENVLLYLNSNLTAWQVYTPCVCMCVCERVCVSVQEVAVASIHKKGGAPRCNAGLDVPFYASFHQLWQSERHSWLALRAPVHFLPNNPLPLPSITPMKKRVWLLHLLQHIEQKNR